MEMLHNVELVRQAQMMHHCILPQGWHQLAKSGTVCTSEQSPESLSCASMGSIVARLGGAGLTQKMTGTRIVL